MFLALLCFSFIYYFTFSFKILAVPCGLYDLSSPTQDWTTLLAVKAGSWRGPNCWTARESPCLFFREFSSISHFLICCDHWETQNSVLCPFALFFSQTTLNDDVCFGGFWRRKWQPPLQCSCLENPRDRGAWWAAIYGVAQSRTWLTWLSSKQQHLCR